jgi:hypothetical protein
VRETNDLPATVWWGVQVRRSQFAHLHSALHACRNIVHLWLSISNIGFLLGGMANRKAQFTQRRRGSNIGRRHGAFSSPSHVNAYRGDGVGARHSEASAASRTSPEWRLKVTRGV